MGMKQRSAHQGEWPMRFNTKAAGTANSASDTVRMTSMEVSNGIGIITVPNRDSPAEA